MAFENEVAFESGLPGEFPGQCDGQIFSRSSVKTFTRFLRVVLTSLSTTEPCKRGCQTPMADNPFYRFFRTVSFPLERRLWDRMPRHPAFKHEYWDGALHWTPRPNTCDCYLDLATWQQPPRGEWSVPREEVGVRQLGEADWKVLPRVFLRGVLPMAAALAVGRRCADARLAVHHGMGAPRP